jgi:enamine deaminase RidA (YjgF/YER057c/UK114 family)
MQSGSRRTFLGRLGAAAVVTAGAPSLLAAKKQTQQPMQSNHHIQDGVFYFYGTGANDGYPDSDQVTVTDPFEKHVSRTMEALKKTLETHGCSIDSILQLNVFLCLPLSGNTPLPTGKARFDAYQAQYEALNRIYRPYFSDGQAPARACMGVDWIPGNSLIEIAGCARIVGASGSSGD